jgi:methylaspartate ammonia-lyase
MDKHTFTLKDFKMSKTNSNDPTNGTDIYNDLVEIYLNNKVEILPDGLANRIEKAVNGLILRYEGKYDVTLSPDMFKIYAALEIHVKENLFSVFIVLEEEDGVIMDVEDGECRIAITPADSDYQTVKDFYFQMLSKYFEEQVERIKSCIA